MESEQSYEYDLVLAVRTPSGVPVDNILIQSMGGVDLGWKQERNRLLDNVAASIKQAVNDHEIVIAVPRAFAEQLATIIDETGTDDPVRTLFAAALRGNIQQNASRMSSAARL